jgi:acetyl-CoA carboxylase biotin carboxyl carrier protein
MTEHQPSDHRLDEVTTAVRALAEVMRTNGLTKIGVELGALSIKLSAGGSRQAVPQTTSREAEPALPLVVVSEANQGHLITAPMIGTFYLTPAPGEPPFVQVGERIETGQTVGIIEAMKIMNEIPADRSGTVVEILVTNSQAVEYGSPLLRILPDEDVV